MVPDAPSLPCRAWSLLLPLLALGPTAAQHDQKKLVQLRDEKLAQPVFQKAPWLSDYDRARARAQAEHKLIFAYFAVSYTACPPCDELENGALADPAFAAFARDVVLLLHVTSRVEGEPHGSLLREKGFSAFPTLCFLSADGDVIAAVGSTQPRTVPAFAALHQRARAVVDLRTRVAAGDQAATKGLFLAELELDLVPLHTVQQRADALPLTDVERTLVAARTTDLEVRDLLARSRDLGATKVEAAIAAMARAGRRPTEATAESFWWTTLTFASENRDAALAQRAYDELSARFGKDQRYGKMMPRWQKLLEQARK